MSLYSNIIQRERAASTILTISVLLGLAYPVVADSVTDWIGKLNGLLVGIFGGVTIVIFELYVFFLPRKVYPFSVILFMKIVSYTITFIIIIVSVVLVTRSIEYGVSISDYFQHDDFRNFITYEGPVISAYAFSGIVIVITTRQISRKMGPGEFFNYVIGTYHKPKREHRIFLSIDLKNSTAIAEQLGELRFHQFLKRFFYDLTYSIMTHQGQIYRYVGDQVMISWVLENGLHRNNAVKCFLHAQKYFSELEASYLQHFGLIPKFRGVLDMGEVLTAQIGLDKQQIVFYGEVVQRIDAIEDICKKEMKNLLLSEYLAVPLKQSREFEFIHVCNLDQDSAESVQLVTLKEK